MVGCLKVSVPPKEICLGPAGVSRFQRSHRAFFHRLIPTPSLPRRIILRTVIGIHSKSLPGGKCG